MRLAPLRIAAALSSSASGGVTLEGTFSIASGAAGTVILPVATSPGMTTTATPRCVIAARIAMPSTRGTWSACEITSQ